MLSPEEFLRLQQLANIKLSPEEQVKLGTQLDNIIQFIGQLDQIKISSTNNNKKPGLTLRTIAGVREFPDAKKLLDNVKHPLVNNSIVIKSALG
jgi:Asp-tRNA(Asn)/Glu-tRNA(Gln) amidotransferase C subunit